MKRIFFEFSGVVIAGMVLLVIFTLLQGVQDGNGNEGIYAALGSHLNFKSENYSAYEDGSAVNRYAQRDKPTIYYQEPVSHGQWKRLVAQKESCLFDFIKAYDQENQMVNVEIKRIVDSHGIDVTDQLDRVTGNITFADKGIYQITVQAEDAERVRTIRKFSIPVETRERRKVK